MYINIPETALVLMVGPTGSGKSFFANEHFAPTEVLSSDTFRLMVSNTEEQEATEDAFNLLLSLTEKRLKRKLLTVIDATNLNVEDREEILMLGRRNYVPVVALVMDTTLKTCQDNNRKRNNSRPSKALYAQYSLFKETIGNIKYEGFSHVHFIDPLKNYTINLNKLWVDKKNHHGPFDIIGDVHGCFNELRTLVDNLGYTVKVENTDRNHYIISHPENRKLVFVGDIVDRGPDNVNSFLFVMDAFNQGHYCVRGNHDKKFEKWISGKDTIVELSHGFKETKEQFDVFFKTYGYRHKDEINTFLKKITSHIVLSDGKLIVAHAGILEEMIGGAGKFVSDFCTYGEKTLDGKRYVWSYDYKGEPDIVYGHMSVTEAHWINNTICVDTGCVYGNRLTALRWPERELIAVDAEQEWYNIGEYKLYPMLPRRNETTLKDVSDVIKYTKIENEYGSVTLNKKSLSKAFETINRFGANPSWITYIPSTTATVESSLKKDYLEHPDEAILSYKEARITDVFLQKKHMGSRGIVLIKKNNKPINMFPNGKGAILSKNGRPFFDEKSEDLYIEKIRKLISDSGLWNIFGEWVIFDCEILPWSLKAKNLIEDTFMATSASSNILLENINNSIKEYKTRNMNDEINNMMTLKESDITSFQKECKKYISNEDVKIYPFFIIASEKDSYFDKSQDWHIETINKISDDILIKKTENYKYDLNNETDCLQLVKKWEEFCLNGEGGILKANTVIETIRNKIPFATKIRGKEFLKLVYGPDYLSNLPALKKRNTNKKRILSKKGTFLAMEGIFRLINNKGIDNVNSVILASLALNEDEIDQKL